jgi:hypothetical protein
MFTNLSAVQIRWRSCTCSAIRRSNVSEAGLCTGYVVAAASQLALWRKTGGLTHLVHFRNVGFFWAVFIVPDQIWQSACLCSNT